MARSALWMFEKTQRLHSNDFKGQNSSFDCKASLKWPELATKRAGVMLCSRAACTTLRKRIEMVGSNWFQLVPIGYWPWGDCYRSKQGIGRQGKAHIKYCGMLTRRRQLFSVLCTIDHYRAKHCLSLIHHILSKISVLSSNMKQHKPTDSWKLSQQMFRRVSAIYPVGILFLGYQIPKAHKSVSNKLSARAYLNIFLYIYTSSAAQGGGGSFRNRKPIGEVGCCESRMAERIHWWTERWLELCFFGMVAMVALVTWSVTSPTTSGCSVV